ncbi:pentapeptide repeat-containing protein [Enterobacter sp. ENT03]|nr:pentapeptide repeat-containing protein [Enterobacter sp. ENT03]
MKTTTLILSAIKETLIRVWNWKKHDHVSLPKINERISNKVFINELNNNEIYLSQICFPDKIESEKDLRVKNITFSKCIFSQSIIDSYIFIGCSFINCSFNGSKISSCEFHKCSFSECTFYKTKFIRTYIDPVSFKFSWMWHWHWANVNAWLFQALYKNSKDMHQEKFAMYADKKFHFYRRYEFLRGQKRYLGKFITSLLYDYILGYGYGIKNALVITLIMISSFAYIIDGHLKTHENSFFKALYFSVVSFTTVGYGDIGPEFEAFPMAITIFFLLISMIWFAVVTAIVVKRIVR